MRKLQNGRVSLDFCKGECTGIVDVNKKNLGGQPDSKFHVLIEGNLPPVTVFSQAMTIARAIENYAAVQTFLNNLPE